MVCQRRGPSKIAPGDLEAGKIQIVSPEPHHLIAIVEHDADGVMTCDVPFVDLTFHHAVLAAVSGPPHEEAIGGDSVPLQPALGFRAPAILASRYQEHGCLGFSQTDRLINEVDRLVDLVMLGATGIIRTAVAEKGERPVQIEDHALTHRRHFLRSLTTPRMARCITSLLRTTSMPLWLRPWVHFLIVTTVVLRGSSTILTHKGNLTCGVGSSA